MEIGMQCRLPKKRNVEGKEYGCGVQGSWKKEYSKKNSCFEYRLYVLPCIKRRAKGERAWERQYIERPHP